MRTPLSPSPDQGLEELQTPAGSLAHALTPIKLPLTLQINLTWKQVILSFPLFTALWKHEFPEDKMAIFSVL